MLTLNNKNVTSNMSSINKMLALNNKHISPGGNYLSTKQNHVIFKMIKILTWIINIYLLNEKNVVSLVRKTIILNGKDVNLK